MNYKNYRQKLKQKLNEKIQQELSSFQKETLSKSPQEIFDAAYQIIIKNDIAECIFNANYSPQEVKTLLKSSDLLHGIYEDWLKIDDSHMEELNQVVTDFTNYMVRREKILSGKER